MVSCECPLRLLLASSFTTYGVHSPGRFFAALELKCMLALTLLKYDVRMAEEGVRPADEWYGLASVPSHSFSIEKVHAKRVFSKSISGIDLRLTQVQELAISSVDKDEINFKASAYLPDTMIENHAMWWECSLHADLVDVESAVQLHSLADNIVSKIDDVGYENNGPFQKEEIQQPEESVLTVPFW